MINTYYDNLLIGELFEIPYNLFKNLLYKGYQYNESLSFVNLTSDYNFSNEDSFEIFKGEDNLYLFTDFNDIKYNKYTCFSNFMFNLEKNIKNKNNSLYGLSIGLTLDEYNYSTNFMRL